MRALVLLNSAAGTLASSPSGDEAGQIIARFASHGIEADVRPTPAPELASAAAAAARDPSFDLVVAGGGDGTINAIASALVRSAKAFAILPLGTMNQLARELAIPTDLDAAVDAIATGKVTDFNVGQVNDRIFLSFSAIGLYSEIIKHRDTQRRVLGRGKWPAMAVAFLKMITRFPLFRVRVEGPHGSIKRFTPAVFVTLNEHQIELFGVTPYSSNGRSLLNLYLASSTRRLGLLWLLARAFIGLLRPASDFEVVCVTDAEISTRRKHFRVAIDGEVIDLPTPLRYRLIPAGLRMVVPAAAPRKPGLDESSRQAERILNT